MKFVEFKWKTNNQDLFNNSISLYYIDFFFIYFETHEIIIYRQLLIFSNKHKRITIRILTLLFLFFFKITKWNKIKSKGRLNAKIDKFGGIIETNRPDKKTLNIKQSLNKETVFWSEFKNFSCYWCLNCVYFSFSFSFSFSFLFLFFIQTQKQHQNKQLLN